MILQGIIGRAGSGKTFTCLQQMRQRLKEDPKGPPIIYLVPEQMTFQAEYQLATTVGIQGMIRAHVYSFTRLAWKVFQETGGLARQPIDSVGVHMLLRKLTEKHKCDFAIYKSTADQTGFIDQLEQMMIEFKRSCVEPEQILHISDHLSEAPYTHKLKDKLQDVYRVFADFEQEMGSKYLLSEDYLSMLVKKIADSKYIQNAEIWIDGFDSFTAQEYAVLEALLIHGQKITLTQTLDKVYYHVLPNEWNLFYSTAKNYQRIYKTAAKNGLNILPEIVLSNCPRDNISCSLAHLERYFHMRPITPYVGETDILIATAVSRRAEIEELARTIIGKVRDQGYRFRDLAIVARNLGDYQEIIETVFQDYQIPVFLDQKKSMLYHPLIELIRSSIDVITDNWRYEAVFRCIRTDLMINVNDDVQMQREALDRLENYIVSRGIQGNRWHYADEFNQDQELYQWKERIIRPLTALARAMERAKTGRQLAEALYEFLVELQVPEKIVYWQQLAESKGELEEANRHQQAWKAVINLLDQIVEIIGEDQITVELFSKIIVSGLESMEFSLVPPAFDQVVVANLDHSRLTDIRCTFLIGVNEGVIPAKAKEDGMLTGEERDVLISLGIEIAPGFDKRLIEEPFVIYKALVSPSEELWVSAPLADEDGKALLPSPLFRQLKEMFPGAKELLWINDPFEESAKGRQALFVTTPGQTLPYLTSQLRYWKRSYPIHPIWRDVYNWYANNSSGMERLQWVQAIWSLFYTNKEQPLSPETSEALYGKHFQTSISRLERHRGCPFAHFANYGLQLKERKMFRLQAPDIGQLFHDALKLITDILFEQNRHWGDVSEQEYQQLADFAVEQLAPKVQNEILLSSKRHSYILRKLRNVITSTAIALSKQAKISQFTPIGLEIGFGRNEQIPPIQFLLDNGATMELRGRIDRVDQAISEQMRWLCVIDYKSSKTSFDLAELYDGISLQMLTYLDVVVTHAEQWLGAAAMPAGALYFHIHNPMVQAKEPIAEQEIDREIFKSYKMSGFVIAKKDIVALMDHTLESEQGGRSDTIPVAVKKDGQFDSRSSILTEDQFEAMRSHMRNTIRKIGQEIQTGTIDIRPYRFKQETPCQFCIYRAVCQFDLNITGNRYRVIEPVRDLAQLFERIGGERKGDND